MPVPVGPRGAPWGPVQAVSAQQLVQTMGASTQQAQGPGGRLGGETGDRSAPTLGFAVFWVVQAEKDGLVSWDDEIPNMYIYIYI